MIGTSTSTSTIEYITKFTSDSINFHTDFSIASLVMNSLSTGSNDIIPQGGDSLGTIQILTVSTPTYTNAMLLYSSDPIIKSDVYFLTNDQLISIIPGNNYQISIDLTCSSSGSISISYQLANYNTDSIPAWVTLDSNNGTLYIAAPDSPDSNSYKIYVNSLISGSFDSVKKLVTIKYIKTENIIYII